MQRQREQFHVLADMIELLDKTLDIAASAERPPAARDNDHPHRLVFTAGDNGVVEFAGQLHIEGVIRLRTIERDGRNAIADIEKNLGVIHGYCLLVMTYTLAVGEKPLTPR